MILRHESIPWLKYFQEWPNVLSSNTVRPAPCKPTMPFAFCPSILSMKNFTFSFGFGWWVFLRTTFFWHLITPFFFVFPPKVILAVLSVFSIMYHILLLITPSMVRMILRSRSLHQSDLPLEEMGKQFELGDWKLLYILSRNMEPLVFGEFIKELYKVLKEARGKNATSAKQPFVVKGLKNDPWKHPPRPWWWCLFLAFKVNIFSM